MEASVNYTGGPIVGHISMTFVGLARYVYEIFKGFSKHFHSRVLLMEMSSGRAGAKGRENCCGGRE